MQAEAPKTRRNPKDIQPGLEKDMRVRQNKKFKRTKSELLAVFKRVLEHDNQGDEAALRALFREASEQLTGLGLSPDGSERWADRLYIKVDKDGSLLFSEAELDLAEEAQKRMEVLYNIDAWTTQLSSRLASGKALLASEGRRETDPEKLVKGAVQKLVDYCRYYNQVFEEQSGELKRIEPLGLRNSLHALGEQLQQQFPELLDLAVRSLDAMAAAVLKHKIKALRNAAALRAMTSIETVKATFPALQKCGVRGAGEQQTEEALERLVEKLKPHLPTEAYDDEYI